MHFISILRNGHTFVHVMQILNAVTSFHAEVKWRDEHYVPNNVEEHLQISMGSITAMQATNFVFISLGNVTTREALDWTFTYPKIVKGLSVHARISNDIMSHEVYNQLFFPHLYH